jgi:hypothetical protein
LKRHACLCLTAGKGLPSAVIPLANKQYYNVARCTLVFLHLLTLVILMWWVLSSPLICAREPDICTWTGYPLLPCLFTPSSVLKLSKPPGAPLSAKLTTMIFCIHSSVFCRLVKFFLGFATIEDGRLFAAC